MSSACVCHIEGEYCFYCEVHLPVVGKYEALLTALNRIEPAKVMKLIIPGTLPTENEIIEAAKKSPFAYREMKLVHTNAVAWYAKLGLRPVERADFKIKWYRINKKSDKDNIMAGQKFIFDGLKEAGIIKNDGWKQIGNVSHEFYVDKENPRVELEIQEAGA